MGINISVSLPRVRFQFLFFNAIRIIDSLNSLRKKSRFLQPRKMQLFALLIATCAPALVAAGRKPGEICAPYPGAFCDEGLTCVSCHSGLPGAPGVVSDRPLR